MVLIPMKFEDSMPNIGYDEASRTATISWSDQKDVIRFKTRDDDRTAFSVLRNEATLIDVK